MKVDFEHDTALRPTTTRTLPLSVWGETDRLSHVLLARPTYLEAVPCCSVTRESLRNGFSASRAVAERQHAALRAVLERNGVACYTLLCEPDFPDQCFVRDVAVTTPWGLVVLNPAKPHRRGEAAHLAANIEALTGARARRITAGAIEGGDVCIARPGLLIIGVSGERTTDDGADEFAAPFHASGWDVLKYHFDPHFLHLDTIFCMVSPTMALACVEVLEDEFLAALADRGITVLPVSYKQARRLGCNVLSIDAHTVVAAAETPEVAELLRSAGMTVHEVEIDQLTACGGGVHCLTMPLARARG